MKNNDKKKVGIKQVKQSTAKMNKKMISQHQLHSNKKMKNISAKTRFSNKTEKFSLKQMFKQNEQNFVKYHSQNIIKLLPTPRNDKFQKTRQNKKSKELKINTYLKDQNNFKFQAQKNNVSVVKSKNFKVQKMKVYRKNDEYYSKKNSLIDTRKDDSGTFFNRYNKLMNQLKILQMMHNLQYLQLKNKMQEHELLRLMKIQSLQKSKIENQLVFLTQKY